MKPLLLLLFCTLQAVLFAQFNEPKCLSGDPTLPDWVKQMYAEKPNVYKVEEAYNEFYKNHKFEPTFYTAQYRRWRRAVQNSTDENGFVVRKQEPVSNTIKGGAPDIWSFAGPDAHINAKYNAADAQREVTEQANVYTIDRSMSSPDVLFCGTESGGVYKTTNQGSNWSLMTRALHVGGVDAVRIHPTDENIVLFQAAEKIWKTIDGGVTWNIVYQNTGLSADDILFHPANPDIIFVASNQGLLRSDNGGNTWNIILNTHCRTVQFRPGTPNIVYTMAVNSATQVAEFLKSTDTGLTFVPKTTGWFQVPTADLGEIESLGGKIAVTEANPDKVYAFLAGQNTAASSITLNGCIGLYVSDDAGETWSLPHGLIGAPYTVATHPNLMNFSGDDGTYNQIYYNTTCVASQLDANKVLIGGLSLWRTDDGGATFYPSGGYAGGNGLGAGLHVDFQELRIFKTSPTTEEIWIASDGGVNYTNDFVVTNPTKTRGIYAGAFWGFDQGWNEDVMVGGRYHNGDAGYYEGYANGDFLALGGGEQPTGYVNYGAEQGRTTHFSDIGGRILPETETGVVESFGTGAEPNESYWNCNSSRTAFDWEYWNTAFMGRENVLWKSSDGGSSFYTLRTFGSIAGNQVLWFEQSYTNPQVMYVQQIVNNNTRLWKTTDGGVNFTQLTLPQVKRDVYFSLGANPDEIYLAYSYGTAGNNIYKSTDGGTTWTNLTTATINGKEIRSVAAQLGTNGGVYIAVQHDGVYYRNASMSDWQPYLTGLPIQNEPLRMVPLYKDNKIRLATWNFAIWEAPLYEPSNLMVNFSTEKPDGRCLGEQFRFVPHCVSSDNATYLWTFPNGTPSSSTDKYPVVTYSNYGNNSVTLKVTEPSGVSATLTKNNFIGTTQNLSGQVQENFETGAFPTTWANSGWQVSNAASANGLGTYSAVFDNYNQDTNGNVDELMLPSISLNTLTVPFLHFDRAYAVWSSGYPDSLAIAVSTDCGATKTRLWVKSLTDLATTTAQVQSNMYVPAAAEWVKDSVDLSAYNGQVLDLTVYFQNIGHYGQAIYLDNINLLVTPTVSTTPVAVKPLSINVFPNPSDDDFNINIALNQKDTYFLKIVSPLGQVVFEKTYSDTEDSINEKIDLKGFPEGSYFMTISDSKGNAYGKFLVKM